MKDAVFEKWTKIYGDGNSNKAAEKKMLGEYLSFNQELKSIYGNVEIYVTQISENESFLSKLFK